MKDYYQTYQLKAKLFYSAITSWQADTLFGAFCWSYLYLYGETELETLLNMYLNDLPPIIFSNGFPGDYLPRPLYTQYYDFAAAQKMNKQAWLNRLQECKKEKKIKYLTLNDFQKWQQGIFQLREVIKEDDLIYIKNTSHNQVSRLTNTVDEDGNFFHLVEWSTKEEYISVYLKIALGYEEKVYQTLELMGQRGIGKKHNLNQGAFTIIKFDIFDGFKEILAPNSFVSLSDFVPANNDPVKGCYKLFVKTGKTDLGKNPFKKSLIMLKNGSVMGLNDNLKPYYGRMIPGLANDKRVCQYGLAFAVPAKVKFYDEEADFLIKN